MLVLRGFKYYDMFVFIQYKYNDILLPRTNLGPQVDIASHALISGVFIQYPNC